MNVHHDSLKVARIETFIQSGEPLKHVITPRGQILVSRTDDDLSCSPCVRPKRSRVYVQQRLRVHRHHAYMCFQHVRVVPALLGDVFLNVHTGATGGERNQFIESQNLVHQFIPMP